MSNLIAFGGWPGAGKDTACDLVAQQLGWPKRAWAADVYRAALALNPYIQTAGQRLQVLDELVGLEVAKREWPEVREFLQRVGFDAGRDIHGEDCWVRRTDLTGPACLTGTRARNEVDAVWAKQGHFVWVERPGIEPPNGHRAENTIGPELADYVLRNDGTIEDLALEVDVMLSTLEALDMGEGW